MMTATAPTEFAARLAVDLDAMATVTDADILAWANDAAVDTEASPVLIDVLNDAAAPANVRTRALAQITAHVLRV